MTTDLESAARAATFDVLDPDLCHELLTTTTVGRVAFVGSRGLVLLPVNYRMVEGEVLIRTSSTSVLAGLAEHRGEVLFEVDYHAPVARKGWSVIVSGECLEVSDPVVLASPELARLVPWTAGEHDVVVRIRPVQVTGRKVRMTERVGPTAQRTANTTHEPTTSVQALTSTRLARDAG